MFWGEHKIKTLIFDIESDGLLDTVTQIHILVTCDPTTNEIKKYLKTPIELCDGTIEDGVRALHGADLIVGHNIIGFDLPLLEQLGYVDSYLPLFKKCLDSFVLSQMVFSNEMKRHGLAAWGKRLGVSKPKHEDWSVLSHEMIHRCVEDVKINTLLYTKLGTIDPKSEHVRLEHKLYYYFCRHQYGCAFKSTKGRHTVRRLNQAIDVCTNEVLVNFDYVCIQEGDPFARIAKSDETLTSHVMKWCENTHVCSKTITGPFSRVKFEPVNLNSSQQVIAKLLRMGWVPDSYTDKGAPSLAKSEFNGIPSEFRRFLTTRNVYTHKRNQINGILDKLVNDVTETPALTSGTNTGRWRHSRVVNIPKGGVIGHVMRSLFVPDEGYIMVGADFSAIEARVLAHYTTPIDGGEYAKLLLEGDPHAANAKVFRCDRDTAKSVGYALMYGAGFKKISEMLGVDQKTGRRLVKEFWRENSAIKTLKENLVNSLESRGVDLTEDLIKQRAYIKTLGGRKIYIRGTHNVLNALIQSAATVAFKAAYCYVAAKIERDGIDARILLAFHDEINLQCLEKDRFKMKVFFNHAGRWVTEHYNLRVPLELDVKFGSNWKEIH